MKQTETKHFDVAGMRPFYEAMSPEGVTFVAHRGGDGGYENTLGAFAAAEEAGAVYVETDIVTTSDGVPIHFHGDRQTRRAVREIEYSDLGLTAVKKAIGYEGDEPIPTLEETLSTFPDLRFFLDLKSKRAPMPVAKIIKQTGSRDRVSIDGMHWKRALRISEEFKGGVSMTMGPQALVTLKAMSKNLKGAGRLKRRFLSVADSFSLPIKHVDSAMMEQASNFGKPVFLHHVETDEHVEFARATGARGIMADRLDLAGRQDLLGQPQKAEQPADVIYLRGHQTGVSQAA